ncbi:acyltransferase family protein [Cohnella sp.]|uniref:acyltransferase family protein n=1 Tax=Cohnella sp. TaxID=1883426 RepID=UPI003563E681
MQKKLILEVDSIRAIACLCVVLLHTIMYVLEFSSDYLLPQGASSLDRSLATIVGLLAFGTPTFVFLSELLLSRTYPDRMPNQFFKRRVIPLAAPFVFISFFYAFIEYHNSFPILVREFSLNLLGDYRGAAPWFIVVILQFYVLHYLFNKFLNNVAAPFLLGISIVINISYLALFNLIEAPSDNWLISYLWDGWYWIPCFGWIFYFSLARSIGRNYNAFIQVLYKHKFLVLLAPIFAITIVSYINSFYSFPFGSKRMDMVLFTTSMILVLFLVTSRLKKQPLMLSFISRYSFGIYLLHIFCLQVLSKVMNVLGLNMGYFNVIIMFPLSVIGSIIAIHLLNKFSFGKYFVGSIRRNSAPLQTRDGKQINLYDSKIKVS